MTTHADTRRLPGEVGTWVFLFGDMLIFAIFFSTFMVERGKAPQLFDMSRKTLHAGIGLTNTLVLLLSSLCVVLSVDAIRRRMTALAFRALAVAVLCGLTFVVLKIVEYTALISRGHGAGANHFYLYYFILTGIHLFHVVIGLLVLCLLMVLAPRREITSTRMAVIESGACFWHLVDLLWIMLFALLYLVS